MKKAREKFKAVQPTSHHWKCSQNCRMFSECLMLFLLFFFVLKQTQKEKAPSPRRLPDLGGVLFGVQGSSPRWLIFYSSLPSKTIPALAAVTSPAGFSQQLRSHRACGRERWAEGNRLCRSLCFPLKGGGSAVSSPRRFSNWLLLITWFIVFSLCLFWGYQFASQLEISNDWWDILFKFILQCERPFHILNKTKAISFWEATDFPAHTTQLALMILFQLM